MEYTGTFFTCFKCNYVYDFNDSCPNCGSEDVEEISPDEIKEAIERLTVMLEKHEAK